ncbi:MAG: ATP-binding protein [Candidatus Helarchaeota archaeon]
MTVEELDVYRELQKHLDKMPIGFPATKSGVEIRLLKHLFTPEEAKIAARLKYAPFPSETIDAIFERIKDLGYSKDELEKILNEMVSKGTLLFKKEGNEKFYGNALFAVGMFEFQVARLSEEFMKDVYRYIAEGYALELFRTKVPQLRTIPIEQSIKPEQKVASYDDIETLIKEYDGPIMVTNCICRSSKDLMGNPCKVTDRREGCFGFGLLGQLYIDQGWGRSVSKEEALKILRQNQEDGLVLQPSNSIELEFICSCCACCCGLLLGKRIFPRPVELFASNFFAQVDEDSCVGCGTCIERCQMQALKLVDDICKVNLDRCIGCGVCVPACPSDAIQLQKKEEENVPPQDMNELYEKIQEKRAILIQEEKRRKEEKRKKREERRKKRMQGK